jgi:ketosteroid isomerase-like protein
MLEATQGTGPMEMAMERTWKGFVFVVLGALAGAVAAQGLTEAEVRAALDRMDRATQARDIDTIASALGDGVQITGTLSVGTTVVERFSYDKRSYLSALRDSWAVASGHTFRRANERIVVSGEVATVTGDLFETATVAGGTLRTQTRGTTTLERVNGVVVVTRAVSEGQVSGEPR